MLRTAERHLPTPSFVDAAFAGVALLLVLSSGVALTQSDGDLFAHLAMGRMLLATHAFPRESVIGLASSHTPLVLHSWLAELLYAGLYQLGGLALIVIVTALVIAAAHATAGVVLRRAGVATGNAVVGVLVSITLGASHWLARPHVFSLLGAALVVALMERDQNERAWPRAALLFFLWANLHAGWMYGLGVVGLYVIGDAVAWMRSDEAGAARARTLDDAKALVAGAAVTFVNPYGWRLHREVLRALSDPTLRGVVIEYRPAHFDNLADILFFAALAVTAVLLVRQRAHLTPARTLVVVATGLLGVFSGRNIALFAVTGWPLAVMVASRAPATPTERRRTPLVWMTALGAVLVLVGLSLGSGADRAMGVTVQPRRFPVGATSAMRGAGLEAPLYAPWQWSGYIAFASQGSRTLIDPLSLGAADVNAYRVITFVEPGWADTLAGRGIAAALVPSRAALADSLAHRREWRAVYADSTATLFTR